MSTRNRFLFPLVGFLVFALAPVALGQYSSAISPGQSGFGGGGYSSAYGGYSSGYGGGGAGFVPATATTQPGFGRPNNLSLVIAQTQEGHEGVSDLLSQLRRLQDQQTRVGLRFNTVNDSFFERIGVGFGFNIRGTDPATIANGGSGIVGLGPGGQPTGNGDLVFNQGGAGAALPPFGGHDPATDATLGFASQGSEGGLQFNFFGGQGSTRSMVTQEPVVVIPNGGSGTVSDTSQVPFVTSIIPVVGAHVLPLYPTRLSPSISPVQQRLQQMQHERIQSRIQKPREVSRREAAGKAAGGGAATSDSLRLGGGSAGGPSSADHGDLSVAEIRRRQARESASDDRELAGWIERARGAEAAGKANVAKIYYRMAARRADGELKQRLIEKLRELEQ